MITKIISNYKARQHKMYLEWLLEEARWDYWRGDYRTALYRLLELFEEVVHEPTEEELENGQGQPEVEQEEQEQEQEAECDSAFAEDAVPERDDDGYLIR